MIEVWHKLRSLFDTNDGSLPDVFIGGFAGERVCAIYAWVISQAGIYDDPTLWSESQNKDIPINS